MLRDPAALRRVLEALKERKRTGRLDGTGLEALAESAFRLAAHPDTPAAESIRLLGDAIRADGANPKYSFHMARVYFACGEFDRAARWLREVGRLSPASHRTWMHVALLQQELNPRYRGDGQYQPDALRERSRRLAGRIRAGADEVDPDLLDTRPPLSRAYIERKARAANGVPDRERAVEAGASTARVRRFTGAGSCRWSGVIDLQAEELLGAEPTQKQADMILPLAEEVLRLAARRPGGDAAFVLLGIEWLLRGYPVGAIARVAAPAEKRDSVAWSLFEAACQAFEEPDPDRVPPLLAGFVEAGRMPPLLAALIHRRRLLWHPLRLRNLGAAVRAAERFLEQARSADPTDAANRERIDGAANEHVNRVRLAARELSAEPPVTLVDHVATEAEARVAPESVPELVDTLLAWADGLDQLRGDALSRVKDELVPRAEAEGDPVAAALAAADARAIRRFLDVLRESARCGLEWVERIRTAAAQSPSSDTDSLLPAQLETLGRRFGGCLNVGNFARILSRLDRRLQEADAPASGNGSRLVADLIAAAGRVPERLRPRRSVEEADSALIALRTRLEAAHSTLAEFWQELRQGETAGEPARAISAERLTAITAFLDSVETLGESALRQTAALRAGGDVADGGAADVLEAIDDLARELAGGRGRFRRRLARIGQATADSREEEAAKPETPSSPLVVLAALLADVRDRVERIFDRAESGFAAYAGPIGESVPIQALRLSVRAMRAEAYFKLGRPDRARATWSRIAAANPFDARLHANIAVADTVSGDIARQTGSWRTYSEVLYASGLAAGSPRPGAAARELLHRSFGGAFAPAALAAKDARTADVDRTSLLRFLSKPDRVRMFVNHWMLAELNAHLDFASPLILLGVDRNAGPDVLARARDRTLAFVTEVEPLLPARIRGAFANLARAQVRKAWEATASARRLTIEHDPTFPEDRDRYLRQLDHAVVLRIRLHSAVVENRDALSEMDMDGLTALARLDRIPLATGPAFLQQVAMRYGIEPERAETLMREAGMAVVGALNERGEIGRARDFLIAAIAAGGAAPNMVHAALAAAVQRAEKTESREGHAELYRTVCHWLDDPAENHGTDSPDEDAVIEIRSSLHHAMAAVFAAPVGGLGPETDPAELLEAMDALVATWPEVDSAYFHRLRARIDLATRLQTQVNDEVNEQVDVAWRHALDAEALLESARDDARHVANHGLDPDLRRQVVDLDGQLAARLVQNLGLLLNVFRAGARAGIRSREQFETLEVRMGRLRERIDRLEATDLDAESSAHLQQIARAVAALLAELAQLADRYRRG